MKIDHHLMKKVSNYLEHWLSHHNMVYRSKLSNHNLRFHLLEYCLHHKKNSHLNLRLKYMNLIAIFDIMAKIDRIKRYEFPEIRDFHDIAFVRQVEYLQLAYIRLLWNHQSLCIHQLFLSYHIHHVDII